MLKLLIAHTKWFARTIGQIIIDLHLGGIGVITSPIEDTLFLLATRRDMPLTQHVAKLHVHHSFFYDNAFISQMHTDLRISYLNQER